MSLVAEIVQLLEQCKISSEPFTKLKAELQTLHKAVTLCEFAAQTFKQTSIGFTISKITMPGLLRCCTVLDELSTEIRRCKGGLQDTVIYGRWRQILGSDTQVAGLETFWLQLAACRMSLSSLLAAMNK